MQQESLCINKKAFPSYPKNCRSNQDYEIYEYKNGIYQGDFFDFKREGYGIYLWNDGQIYIGEWKDDQIHGTGMVFFGFGCYLYGTFSRNKLSGPGILCFNNGDLYVCRKWDNGKLDDILMKYSNESKSWKYIRYMLSIHLEGPINIENSYKEFDLIKEEILKKSTKIFEYKEYFFTFLYTNAYKEKSMGSCKTPPKMCIDFLALSDDAWFYGFIKDGKPDGLGIMGLKKQIICRGVFSQGQLHGIGRYQFENGDIHDGIFLNGHLNLGFIYFEKDQKYIFANFKEGKPEKILSKGRFFPYNLLSTCKQEIYPKNFSYYYKYTPIEVIYLNSLDKNFQSMHPYNPTSFRKNSSSPRRIPKNETQETSPKQEKTKKTLPKTEKIEDKLKNEPFSKVSSKSTKNEPKKIYNNDDLQFNIVAEDERNNHFLPKETSHENSLHRKSISIERSKYLEIMPETFQNNNVNKTTFNNDTPKKVSLPKEKDFDLLKTAKNKGIKKNLSDNNEEGKEEITKFLNEKKPTKVEYTHFINSKTYYDNKIKEIMQTFQDPDEFDLPIDEEKQSGMINILNLKKTNEGPPSFGRNSLKEIKGLQEKRESFYEEMSLEEKKNIQEKKTVFTKDLTEKKNKNHALFIYYDEKEGVDLNVKDYDCKYYNLFNNNLKKLEEMGQENKGLVIEKI